MIRVKYIFLILVFYFLFIQNAELKSNEDNSVIDSTDKTVMLLFDDFYESYESNEGMANPKMTAATLQLMNYQADTTLKNSHLADLLFKYSMSVSEPERALEIIQSLKKEYFKVYGHLHPLILLYQGESLINSGNTKETYKHFTDFINQYPKSVMALVYIYQTEENDSMALTWLSLLKAEHPNHWVVKTLE